MSLVAALLVALSAPVPAPDHTAPTRPEPLTIDVSTGGVVLRWTPSTDDRGPVRYEVYERDRLITTVTGTEYQYSASPPPPAIFILFVRAVDDAGNVSASAYQTIGRVWRGDEVPPPPTGLTLQGRRLSWTAPVLPSPFVVPPVAGYQVVVDGQPPVEVGATSIVLDRRPRTYEVRTINAVSNLSTPASSPPRSRY